MGDEKLVFKVGAKGGVSVYGLGRFPVTLYHGQWMKLLAQDNVTELLAFLEAHKAELKMLPGKEAGPGVHEPELGGEA